MPDGVSARPPENAHDGGGFAPFKIYVLLLSVSLIASALTGITIALANAAARRRTWVLLASGCVVPLLLLFF